MLQENINMYDGRNLERIEKRDLSVGTLCLALYAEDELFYRARILAIHDGKFLSVEVLYLDFGNEGVVKLGHLKKMKREFMNLPFQAFECRLCEVAPMPFAHCPVGAWSPRATQRFIQLTENKKLAAKVYSLVRNVLNLDLYDTSTEEDVHINQVLIDEGFALFQEESRASKMANQNASSGEGVPADDNTAWIDPWIENEPDPRNDVVTKVTLRGPESPIEMGFYSVTNIGRLK
ncbi:putative ATP-dependent RNA helicase TDRD9 [Orbicella faveolata]|uniref:putative ATP-dependent RNA helicase TDRD9 n=1 Tax=Orbicella faveolata TaxID=48498 RepID=UPI0009E4DA4C|nr:putative ATP-dependent RNA helicase TDRD9 [Orbicella faveolata]